MYSSLLRHVNSFILYPLYSAVCKSQLAKGKEVSSIDYSYHLLNPCLSLQSQGHTECNKMSKKGAKFIGMFIYVFI